MNWRNDRLEPRVVVLNQERFRDLVREALVAGAGSMSDLFPSPGTQITLPASRKEDVLRIVDQGEASDASVRIVVGTEEEVAAGRAPTGNLEGLAPFEIIGIWSGGPSSFPAFWTWDPIGMKGRRRLELVSYSETGGFFSRVDGIFETRALSGRHMAIVGNGSVGSFVACEAVRYGIEKFSLVDFDHVAPENVVRHLCDRRDLGRFKTLAVRDAILRVNSRACVTTDEVDVEKSPWVVEELARSADVVVVCTDTHASRFVVNDACVRSGTPSIYAGVYERAFGGHVIRVIPGSTPCYECVYGALLRRKGGSPERTRGRVPYMGEDPEGVFVAEPGLGLDVRFIALIAAKMALLTLLRGTGSALEDFPSDFVFWGNRKEYLFPEPLYAQFATCGYSEECSTCGADRDTGTRRAVSAEGA